MAGILHLTPTVMFGAGAVECAGAEARRLGDGTYLVVTDPGILEAGILEKLAGVLERAGVVYAVFDGVKPDPGLQCVASCLEVAKSSEAVGRHHPAQRHHGRLPGVRTDPPSLRAHLGRPHHGRDRKRSQRRRGPQRRDRRDKKAAYSLVATLAILEPTLTVSMPRAVTGDTGLDALVHAIESNTSANANPFSLAAGLQAVELIAESLRPAAT